MKFYLVDAFTDSVFKGNQAAVYFPENGWPSDEYMTKLCRENNFSDIAILLKKEGGYDLRWFTQAGEIEFCGHASIAASYVVLNCEEPDSDEVHFDTMHGHIVVSKSNGIINMQLDAYDLKKVEVTDAMVEATGCDVRPVEAWLARDLMLVYDDENVVKNMVPDQEKVAALDGLLLHVTAPGKEYDCVSRSFAPKCNVTEDPVCGSGHCHIIPYWAGRLKKDAITAFQASERSGVLYGHYEGDKFFIGGSAAIFAKGETIETQE